MALRFFSPGCPCCCSCMPPGNDLLIVMDTTGSMSGILTAFKSVFHKLRDKLDSEFCRWGLVDYRDYEDGGSYATSGWKVDCAFTSDYDVFLDALDALEAGGGGDLPEQNFDALKNAGSEWISTLGGRSDETIRRIILWAGDAAAWNGNAKPYLSHTYPTRAEVITSLTDATIKVIALNTGSTTSGINSAAATDNLTGAATAICEATNGECINGAYGAAQYKKVLKAVCRAVRG